MTIVSPTGAPFIGALRINYTKTRHEVLDMTLSDLCVCFCASPETERSSQSGLPLRNIHISYDNGSFSFLYRCFLSSITAKTFTVQNCIYEYHGGCLIRSRHYLLFVSTCICSVYFSVVRVADFFIGFCVVLLCVFTF